LCARRRLCRPHFTSGYRLPAAEFLETTVNRKPQKDILQRSPLSPQPWAGAAEIPQAF